MQWKSTFSVALRAQLQQQLLWWWGDITKEGNWQSAALQEPLNQVGSVSCKLASALLPDSHFSPSLGVFY